MAVNRLFETDGIENWNSVLIDVIIKIKKTRDLETH